MVRISNFKNIQLLLLIALMLALTGCSAWKEDFEQKPVRGYPKASIHEISTMVNRGEIKEDDAGSITTISLNSDRGNATGSNATSGGATGDNVTSFYDGEISRGNFPLDMRKFSVFTLPHMKMKTKYYTRHITYTLS